jgi:hypothetical protein
LLPTLRAEREEQVRLRIDPVVAPGPDGERARGGLGSAAANEIHG